MEASGSPQHTRRTFLGSLGIVTLSVVMKLVPLASGLAVFLNPLWRKSKADAPFSPVAKLKALPADGAPRRFAVLAERVNAWNRSPNTPVGAVYLRRTDSGQVKAFSATCPHAGCLVGYDSQNRAFACPCHKSSFTLEGGIGNTDSPSPRGLDELEVQVEPNGQILVKYQNFRTGLSHQEPVS